MEGQKDPLALEVLSGGVLTAAPDTVAVSENKESWLLFRWACVEVSHHQNRELSVEKWNVINILRI
jgi:hypothetical protein